MTQTNAINTFLEFCNPLCASLSAAPLEEDWNEISRLAQWHGLTPFFFYRMKTLGITLPEELRRRWVGSFLFQMGQERKARVQIKELKEILDPEGIPFILLKGTSAMLRLYPDQGFRTFCDIDILIPPEEASLCKQKMAEAGYKPSVILNPPEEEEVLKFECHLPAIRKDEGLPIETHLGILGRPRNGENGLGEIWGEKEEGEMDGVKVYHLSREHYVIHMLLHFEKHLRTEGNIQIKSLVDVLRAVRTWTIDWERLWNQARRWKIQALISPVVATLNHHWQAGILDSEKGAPFDLGELIPREEELQKSAIQGVPAGFLHRLSKARELPGFGAWMRFVFRIFFPTCENLYWRYGFSEGRSILSYQLLHISTITKRFFNGFLSLGHGVFRRFRYSH